MNDKRRQLLLDAAAPLLEADEKVEITTIANVGSVSVKKKVLTAAVAGIATGGLVTANVRPRQMYVILTDRKILFFDADTSSGRPGKHMATLSREGVSSTEPKSAMLGLALGIELSIAGQERDLKIVFPKPSKEEGQQFAVSLPRSL
ncbi:MAG TPA: hypothetical protein VFA06_21185 [Actinocrinis sp.]|uniref:hypothetical protein n=1 Tax=Actinocrinis sp. TaxID=1920516 RepID=UPI002D70AC00|nr:hypothetical protein [Actinocrinis sp.]HZU58407.1 hypothetical protein [Actinocrinis sp.]